ncbi:MAG TPA: response regulator [Polyangiaceae bacterium]|nr:response regulator [Polyangiaceae bacterium]
MKALVVDDSRAIRMIIARQLKSLGFSIVEANDGREALAALRSVGPFDIALVDWNMPVMNGLELVLEVRSDRSLDEMAIMMVTTESEQTQVIRAIEAGASEYLMKPFSPEAFEEKLVILGLKAA